MNRIFSRALPVAVGALLATAAGAEPWEAPLHRLLPTHRARLGIEIQSMTPELRAHFKAPPDRGVLVVRIASGSAAERAGMQVGDVIVGVDGKPVSRPFDLVRRAGSAPEGEPLTLQLVRNGETHRIDVRPEGTAQPWVDPECWEEWIGRGLREGSEQLRDRLEELERRLQELERKLEPPAGPGQKT